ncbi:MAG: transglycosylase domain-containing protein, partial [Anaerolineales bacterium]|nr:transglycosylase domain-containing protein [Anaerolineales bacterium]
MKRLRRGLLLAFVLIVGGGALAYNVLFGGLPHPRDLAAHRWQPSVRITDRNGRLLYDVIDANSGRNIVLPLAQIPRQLRQATIDTEDGSFYTNPGVDVVGIVRAFWINLRGGEVLAGGSTITQQVSRNLL